MPEKEQFFIPLGLEDDLRVRITTSKWAVTHFTVQHETLVDGHMVPVVRYDTAHGQAHIDVLNRRGDTVEKIELGFREPYNEALHTMVHTRCETPLAIAQTEIPRRQGTMTRALRTNAARIEVDPDRQLAMLDVFVQDILADPELARLIPEGEPGLDLYPRGSRSDSAPDFQTPRVDVYVLSREALNRPERAPLD